MAGDDLTKALKPKRDFTPPRAGDLRLPHHAVAALLTSDLTGQQIRLLLAIIDETKGWNRKSVSKRTGYWELRTGIHARHVPRALAALEFGGWIRWEKGVLGGHTDSGFGTRNRIEFIMPAIPKGGDCLQPRAIPKGGDGAIPEGGDTYQTHSSKRERGHSENGNSNGNGNGNALRRWIEQTDKHLGVKLAPDDVVEHVQKLNECASTCTVEELDRMMTMFLTGDTAKFKTLSVFVNPKWFTKLKVKAASQLAQNQQSAARTEAETVKRAEVTKLLDAGAGWALWRSAYFAKTGKDATEAAPQVSKLERLLTTLKPVRLQKCIDLFFRKGKHEACLLWFFADQPELNAEIEREEAESRQRNQRTIVLPVSELKTELNNFASTFGKAASR